MEENQLEPDKRPLLIQRKSRSSYGETCFDLIYSLVFTILFWIKLGETNPAQCHESVFYWSNYAKYYYLVNSIVSFVSLFFLALAYSRDSFSTKFIVSLGFFIIVTLIRVAGIALVAGMIISFTHRHECPSLSWVIMIQFITIMIILGLFILGLCCIFTECCIIFASDAKSGVAAKPWGELKSILRPFLPFLRLTDQQQPEENKYRKQGYENI